jgi:hypothetical protein
MTSLPNGVARGVAAVTAMALALLASITPAGAQQPETSPESASTGAAAGSSAWRPEIRPDGQPDIEGRWRAHPTGTFDLTDPKTGGGRIQELLDIQAGRPRQTYQSRVVDPPDGQIPYQPWAREKQQAIAKYAEHPLRPEHIDPQTRCLPGAVPRSFFHSANHIVQPPGYVVFLTTNNHAARIIPLDGRPPLGHDIKLWMGDSRGRWEGNTLVVDVRNQNAKGRFDMVGNFASDEVYIEERWTIVDENTIDYTATFHDPNVYTRPWTIRAQAVRIPPSDEPYGDELWEDACHEGERSADHLILDQPRAEEAP